MPSCEVIEVSEGFSLIPFSPSLVSSNNRITINCAFKRCFGRKEEELISEGEGISSAFSVCTPMSLRPWTQNLQFLSNSSGCHILMKTLSRRYAHLQEAQDHNRAPYTLQNCQNVGDRKTPTSYAPLTPMSSGKGLQSSWNAEQNLRAPRNMLNGVLQMNR